MPENKPKLTVDLDEQHLFEGIVYGPGRVDAPDERTAKVLSDSHARVVKNRGDGPVVKVNGIATGILRNTQPVHGPNTFSPADATKQYEASEAASAKNKKEDDDARKAAKDDRGFAAVVQPPAAKI